jgi:hypothetical protein
MITKAIIQLLMESPQVTALVGDRVEPNILKEDQEYPAIYVSTDAMSKPQCRTDIGVRIGTIEIGVYGNTYAVVKQVVAALTKKLDDFQGSVSGVGINVGRGRDTGDKFDPQVKMHVKIIEYDAVAQIQL